MDNKIFNILVEEVEQNDEKNTNIEGPSEREKALVRCVCVLIEYTIDWGFLKFVSDIGSQSKLWPIQDDVLDGDVGGGNDVVRHSDVVEFLVSVVGQLVEWGRKRYQV